MIEALQRSSLGIGGCLATIGLQQVNTLISISVGLLTLVYLSLQILRIAHKRLK